MIRMIRLFQSNDCQNGYTEKALAIHEETFKTIQSILDKYKDIYDRRDLELIIILAATDASTSMMLEGLCNEKN